MENFLFILAIIGSIIYKIYDNYQVEKEKALQRKAKMRPPTLDEPLEHWEETVYNPPQPEVVELPEPMVILHEESQATTKKTEETSRRDIKNIRNKLDEIRVKPTGQRAHEEAAQRLEKDRARRLALQGRTDTEKNKQLEVIDLDKVEFDLRTAIIQSAILDRPYKD